MILIALAALLSMAVTLPQTGPRPAEKPPASAPQTPPSESPATPPVTAPPAPEPRPTEPPSTEPPSTEPPETEPVPKPASKPEPEPEAQPPSPPQPAAPDETGTEPPAEPVPPPPTISPESEAELNLCKTALTELGAGFAPIERIDDGDGCGIDKPIRLERILPGVALAPAADLRCETALQLARFVKQSLIPLASAGLPDMGPLTSVNHASAYVCRKRNGASTGKISEHARGNGIDIGSLSFGRIVLPMRIVPAEGPTLDDAFQRAMNATACLYFSTVLSPGSDAAHQDHMHLDVLARTGGYRYCR